MRMILYGAVAAALFLYSPGSRCQTQEQQQQGALPASVAGQAAASSQASGNAPPQQESLAEAARKAQEEKKALPKAAKVFTNDNLPPEGVAPKPEVTAAPAGPQAPKPSEGAAAAGLSGTDEKGWRERFADLRHKLEQDQADLQVMQRELGVLNEQYYGDPNKAMHQQYSREDINKKTADIEARKKQVAEDQQAIDDAETDLRHAGGDPSWAR